MTSRPTSTAAARRSLRPSGSACANCGHALSHVFADLGWQPLCESFVPATDAMGSEEFFPLIAYVCQRCFLVQVPPAVRPEEIFTDYAYFSSYSDSWVEHARRYVDAMVERFELGADSFVVELASNDGYLLQGFVERGIPCLGIEPAENVAAEAIARGVPTLPEFFGEALASRLVVERGPADQMVGNNVLAQVPRIHDFIEGIRILLAPDGVLTLEFPHLVRLMEGNEFDTIYHEHFFYFSLYAVRNLLSAHDLRVFDVDELPTHGGSLRLYVCHQASERHREQPAVANLADEERHFGVLDLDRYAAFQRQVETVKYSVLDFLIREKRAGHQIVAYGAPGKGNTLLNYCGVRSDFVDYVVDRNPGKQGAFTPGTHIPILHPDEIRRTRPDVVLVMPWNIKDEIVSQHRYVQEWGGRFVIFLPEVLELRDGAWVPPSA